MKVRHWVFVGVLLALGVGGASLVSPGDPRAVSEADAVEPAQPTAVNPPPAPPAAGAPELALVAPLAVGSDLAGWTIDHIEGVRDGTMLIVVDRGEEQAQLQIALDAPDQAPAPVREGRYAIYFARVEATQGRALAEALQAVIATHADVAVPPGLGPLPTPVGT